MRTHSERKRVGSDRSIPAEVRAASTAAGSPMSQGHRAYAAAATLTPLPSPWSTWVASSPVEEASAALSKGAAAMQRALRRVTAGRSSSTNLRGLQPVAASRQNVESTPPPRLTTWEDGPAASTNARTVRSKQATRTKYPRWMSGERRRGRSTKQPMKGSLKYPRSTADALHCAASSAVARTGPESAALCRLKPEVRPAKPDVLAISP
mmetsp:Transcript_6445/g.26605  ORF Transcript_6445/g.26605 Transcript_6445/m.26605 type:complete len:208 (-) Transcript_6445:29-652(-)